MRYKLDRGDHVTRDLERIYVFLFESFVGFGDHSEEADRKAADRVLRVEAAMERLATIPHQGTLHPRMLPGLRSVTKDRAIFYFVVDDEARIVRVLAIFFGGQDHQRLMLRRLLSE